MSENRSVLLIHGMASSRSTWWRVGPALERGGWEVVSVNLAGHGGRVIGEVRSVAGLATDVVRQRPVGATLVVGHSLGAIVALELARAYPAYARGVLLEDPPALHATRASDEIDEIDEIEEDLAGDVLRARADPHGAIAAILAGHPSWNRRDARSMLEGRLMTDPQLASWSPGDLTWSLPTLVAACPVPVALLAARGRGSALLEPDRSELLGMLAPGRVTEVAGSHHVHLDEPEQWVQTVERFGASI